MHDFWYVDFRYLCKNNYLTPLFPTIITELAKEKSISPPISKPLIDQSTVNPENQEESELVMLKPCESGTKTIDQGVQQESEATFDKKSFDGNVEDLLESSDDEALHVIEQDPEKPEATLNEKSGIEPMILDDQGTKKNSQYSWKHVCMQVMVLLVVASTVTFISLSPRLLKAERKFYPKLFIG